MPTNQHKPVDNGTPIDVEKNTQYWVEVADDDFQTMQLLYQSKEYTAALFIGYVMLEKLLKVLYVQKHKKHAPRTGNLLRLAHLCELELTEERTDMLEETAFFESAIYDDLDSTFFNRCTHAYATEWVEKINQLRQWIKTKL
jgi:HEPN domain-containing protein